MIMTEILIAELNEFIKTNYAPCVFYQMSNVPIDELEKQLEDTFSVAVLKIMEESGEAAVDFYKRANIDRKLFSKMKNDVNYKPSKETAILIALALHLNMADCQNLLGKAGYCLSRSSLDDVIVAFFIKKGIFDIDLINEALEQHKLKTIGC